MNHGEVQAVPLNSRDPSDQVGSGQKSLVFVYAIGGTLMEARGLNSEKGASLVEYALLVALIAVACIVAIRALGSKISQQFSYTGGQL